MMDDMDWIEITRIVATLINIPSLLHLVPKHDVILVNIDIVICFIIESI